MALGGYLWGVFQYGCSLIFWCSNDPHTFHPYDRVASWRNAGKRLCAAYRYVPPVMRSEIYEEQLGAGFSVLRYLFASVLSKSQSRSEISFSCMCFWLAFERCASGSLCIGASFNIVAQTCQCICSALCSARHPSKPK